MATLQQKIAEKFLTKLADSKDVDAAKIDQLRILLADDKKPTAEDFGIVGRDGSRTELFRPPSRSSSCGSWTE